MEAVLTIAAFPDLARSGLAATHMRMVPVRFTSTTFLNVSMSYSAPRMMMPAQFTNTSRLSKRASKLATCASLVTSSCTALRRSRAGTALISSGVKPVTVTA